MKTIEAVYLGKRLATGGIIRHAYHPITDAVIPFVDYDKEGLNFSKKRHNFGSIGTIFKLPTTDGVSFGVTKDPGRKLDDQEAIGNWIAEDKAAWLEKQTITINKKVPTNDYNEGIQLLKAAMYRLNRRQKDLLKMRIFLDLK